MAGTTYSNLTTDIRNYTEVDADVLTTAVINRFIEDAEFRIYQELPMDSQRFVQEGTLGKIRVLKGSYLQGWLGQKEEDTGENKQAEWRTDPLWPCQSAR